MMWSDSLENLIARHIERAMSRLRSSERHGIVSSYDSKKHLAKITLKPEDQETGWLPIETGHIGKSYGMVMGLQPGQSDGGGGGAGGAGGQGSTDNTGDQVIVRFHEGDFESGKVVARVHSDKDTPPEAKAGEIIIWTVFKEDENKGPQSAETGQKQSTGQKIYWKNDGSISTEDGGGAIRVMDGKGNYTVTAL